MIRGYWYFTVKGMIGEESFLSEAGQAMGDSVFSAGMRKVRCGSC